MHDPARHAIETLIDRRLAQLPADAAWRGDAALIFGLTSRDPGIGFAAGFTYVFQAFQIP